MEDYMENIIDYLKEFQLREGIKSVNALAIRLGIPQSTMNAIFKNKMIPSDEMCEKFAAITNHRPEIVIALAHKSRAKGSTVELWNKILKAVSAATLVALFFAQIGTIALDRMNIMSNRGDCSH